MKRSLKRVLGISGLSVITVLSSQAQASGYRLEFQSPSVLADAGEAAVVEDAGTNWYNAAGLVYLPQQVTLSAIDVYAPTTFTGSANASPLGPTLVGSASSHPNNILPAMHYVFPYMQNQVALGISVVPAWGFSEDYGGTSMLRYDLARVYTKTIDISPSLAFRINPQWSVGLGPDFHYFSVLSRTHFLTEPFTINDSISRFSADDWASSLHAGLLFRANDCFRVGLNYRSKVNMHLRGHSVMQLGVPLNAQFDTNNFTLNIPLPPTTSLSVYGDINPVWALMGTITYDQWSVLRDYHATNYQGIGVIVPDVVQQQSMHNTFDLSVGTHYRLNDQWLLRGSIKYEPTPTNNNFRDVNFPDGTKLGFQIGSRYQMNPRIAIDLIYGHVFIRNASIHGLFPPQIYPNTVAASGHSKTSVNLAGAQIVWNI